MKRSNSILSKIMLGSIATAVAIMASLPGAASAADETKPMKPMKGGEHMMMLQGINTQEQADALKTDDSIAMVCAKCKTLWVTRVKQGSKGVQLLMGNGQPTELIGTHACAGCNST